MRRLGPGESQWLLQLIPMRLGPTLQDRHFTDAGQDAEKDQREQCRQRVPLATAIAKIPNVGKDLGQRTSSAETIQRLLAKEPALARVLHPEKNDRPFLRMIAIAWFGKSDNAVLLRQHAACWQLARKAITMAGPMAKPILPACQPSSESPPMSHAIRPLLVGLLAWQLALSVPAAAGQFSVEQHPGRVTVNIDGKLFTEYLTKVGTKPILWPIIGPTGLPMTRAYPMQDLTDEKHDHPHQRSLWFTHGDVNGIDFWSEPISYKAENPADKRFGSIVHHDFLVVEADGDKAVIRTSNDWVDGHGKKQCDDVRTVTCSIDGDARVIDFDITLKASAGAGDLWRYQKGASASVCPPAWMSMPSKAARSSIATARPIRLPGQAGARVDYHGPVDGEQSSALPS